MALSKEERLVEIVMNSKQPQASLKELEKGAAALRSQLKGMATDSKDFAEKSKELQGVEKRLKGVRDEVKGVSTSFSELKNQIKNVAIGAIAFVGFQALTGSMGTLIAANAKLSDQYADIQKTTGMTRIEVEKLDASLGNMQTRTAKADLRDIAIAAGQLGYSGKEVLPFVNAMDKLNVALGDEFADSREITTQLGKLRNVLVDVRSVNAADDMLKLGNAINVLSSEGAATAPVLADFANRIGGSAINLGLTSAQVLGLSSTLQELNVSTERGGTAVVRILDKMLNNTSEFAKVANMKIQPFTDLLNKDLFGAFVKVMEGVKATGKESTVLAGIIKDLELQGAGASEVFGKLSNNTDLLTKRNEQAAGALTNTSSIMNEFSIKNETFAAKVEKIQKAMAGAFTNSAFKAGLDDLATGILQLIGLADATTMAFEKQQAEVNNLTTNVEPLINTYERLSLKKKLNKDESDKLKDSIAKIAENIPTAISAFDKYGKAMGINTEIARAYVKEQKNILQLDNENLIKAQRVAMFDLRKEIDAMQKALSRKDAKGNILMEITTLGGAQSTQVIRKEVKATNEYVAELQTKLEKKQIELETRAAKIAQLSGEKTKGEKAVTDTGTGAENAVGGTAAASAGLALTDSDKDKILKAFQDLIKDIEDERKKLVLSGMADKAKELQEVEFRYTELRKRAKGHSKEIAQINELEKSAIAQINKKYEAKDAEALLKMQKAHADAWAMMTEATDTEADKQIKVVEKKYADIAEKMKAAGEDTAMLEELKNAEILAIVDKYWAEIDAKREKNDAKEASSLETKAARDAAHYFRKVKESEQFANQISSIWAGLNATLANSEDKMLAKEKRNNIEKKKDLDRLLEYKKISQANYNTQVVALDEELDAKTKEIRLKQAKREKALAVFNSVINTAMAASQINANPAVNADFTQTLRAILTGLVIAAGTAQTIAIATQPLPEFAMGGPTIAGGGPVNSEFVGRIGEKGPEWVAPNWMLKSPATANVIGMLEAVRQTRSFASGGSTTAELPTQNNVGAAAPSGGESAALMGTLEAIMNELRLIRTQGVKGVWDFDYYTKSLEEIERSKSGAKLG
jgi:TP901 family phage tail tape measure protein